MNLSVDEQLTEQEARAIMSGGLGKAELEFVTSLCTPLYWAYVRDGRELQTRNGTAFFLNAGQGVFAVTAQHVVEGWRQTPPAEKPGPLRLGGNGTSLAVDWAARVIDECPQIDIASFRVTDREVRDLGKTVLTGFQKSWPPPPPPVRCGVYYCGYPGVGTRQLSTDEVNFGAVPGSGVASSVNDRDISSLIEREHLMAVFGGGLPPENFDFGGISGGPMLTVVQNTLRSWMLSGVIYQGPNPSGEDGQSIAGLEIIKARRADFIKSDGTLDRNRL